MDRDKFLSEIRKIIIAIFSTRYVYTNGRTSYSKKICKECPKCGASEENTMGRGGPMVYFGHLRLFGIFDTDVKCEEVGCRTCGHRWNKIFY